MEENLMRMKRTLKTTTEISANYGLELNKSKTKVLILHGRTDEKIIEGVEIVKELKYLGFYITNKKNIFTNQKTYSIKKAQNMCNMTYSVIERAVNKTIIGKTYWKQVVLPSILYGNSIMEYTKTELDKLQVIENAVYRKVLVAASYTPVECLRGDIGASCMENRYYRNKLTYYRYLKTCKNDLLKEILRDMEEKKYDIIEFYRTIMSKMNIKDICEETVDEIKEKVRIYDNKCWKFGMNTKSSIELYRKNKDEIKEEDMYDNSKRSNVWFKIRTNTLNLNDRKRFENGNTFCELCGKEEENLNHFLLKCEKIQNERNQCIELQKPLNLDEGNTMEIFIYQKENIQRKMKTAEIMWLKRYQLINNI